MPTFVLSLFRFAGLLFSGHAAVAVENAALRLQLAAFQRKRRQPVLTSIDRLFCTDCLPASPEVAQRPSQTWWTLLHHHLGQIILLHCAHDHDEGAVRVHRVGTSPSRGAAFPCDGASLSSLGVAADRRSLRQSESATGSSPRP